MRILIGMTNSSGQSLNRLTARGRAHMASETESRRRLTEAIGLLLKTAE
jgi:hypothetical protein